MLAERDRRLAEDIGAALGQLAREDADRLRAEFQAGLAQLRYEMRAAQATDLRRGLDRLEAMLARLATAEQ